LPFCYRELL